jgi:hypothetical protein
MYMYHHWEHRSFDKVCEDVIMARMHFNANEDVYHMGLILEHKKRGPFLYKKKYTYMGLTN